MYEAYQEWASRTYGDSAKTKTVTKKKYNRIVKILKGEESSNVENSKFRFWVKAKGFKLGPVEDGRHIKDIGISSKEQVLYVPSCKVAGSSSASKSQTTGKDAVTDYKRVAVVENFYHIIYSVHVEMDGRSGKHAGQKRTYRAVAEMYAFLPREAVTRFLMSCSDCQKRMHLQPTTVPPSIAPAKSNVKKRQLAAGGIQDQQQAQLNGNGRSKKQHTEIDFSLPITTTYLKRMKSLGYRDTSELLSFEDQISNGSPLLFGSSSSPEEEDEEEEGEEEEDGGEEQGDDSNEEEMASATGSEPSIEESGLNDNCTKTEQSRDPNQACGYGNGGVYKNGLNEGDDIKKEPQTRGRKVTTNRGERIESREEVKREGAGRNSHPPLNGSLDLTMDGGKSGERIGNGIRSRGIKRKESFSPDTVSKSELVIAGLDDDGDQEDDLDREVGDDDEDEDEEGPGRSSTNCDIERLKAFNMFVRLFVDENLDRMVPISRQPKDKVQAIIESCNRQFPEFMERARKRIRTYLKSCRRTRRHKTSPTKENPQSNSNPSTNNGEPITCAQLPVSTTSYHLSSPLAEQILATACDNEVQNAKRMRVGLKPIGVVETSSDGDPEDLSLGSFIPSVMAIDNPVNNHQQALPLQKPPPTLTGVSSGAAIQVLKPSLSAHTSSSSLLAALCQQKKLENDMKEPNQVNGPIKTNGILSGFDANQKMKGDGTAPTIYSLNPGEMAAVKQLISGYRESAAFLLRSADELENLLFQQPN